AQGRRVRCRCAALVVHRFLSPFCIQRSWFRVGRGGCSPPRRGGRCTRGFCCVWFLHNRAGRQQGRDARTGRGGASGARTGREGGPKSAWRTFLQGIIGRVLLPLVQCPACVASTRGVFGVFGFLRD